MHDICSCRVSFKQSTLFAKTKKETKVASMQISQPKDTQKSKNHWSQTQIAIVIERSIFAIIIIVRQCVSMSKIVRQFRFLSFICESCRVSLADLRQIHADHNEWRFISGSTDCNNLAPNNKSITPLTNGGFLCEINAICYTHGQWVRTN